MQPHGPDNNGYVPASTIAALKQRNRLALVLVGVLALLVGAGGTFLITKSGKDTPAAAGPNAGTVTAAPATNSSAPPASHPAPPAAPSEDHAHTAAPSAGPAPSAAAAPTDFVQLPRVEPKDAPNITIGSADARVTVEIYSDYRCSFCAKFALETLPVLMKKFNHPTKARFEFHDIAVLDAQSAIAAVASRAANQQGKFLEFHDALFGGYLKGGRPDFTTKYLLEVAKNVGIADLAAFEKALVDPTLTADMMADTVAAGKRGISSTPTIVINGKPIAGAQPIAVFAEAIGKALGTG